MNYTEKEQKGVNKVQSMNKFFDKVLLPTIGVLIIFTLITFIVDGLTEKFGGTDDTQNLPKVFSLRAAALENYEKYSDEFASYGYHKVDGYTQELALCKSVDEELVIFQFIDSNMGDFSILRYTPSDNIDSKYDSISMSILSPTLINVTVSGNGFAYTVTFTSVDFSSYAQDDGVHYNDNVQYNKMMKLTSVDELNTLYEIFETDINNLAEFCGLLN